MVSLYQEMSLPNGLTVSINDHTRHYYGDFYLVKLEVVCSVSVPHELLATSGDLLDESITYRRFIEQMGVPATEVELVKKSLLSHFTTHSLSYLAAQNFPEKLAAAALAKARKGLGQQHVGYFQ